MTYWDGTRWVPDVPSPPPGKRPVRHLLGAVAEGTLITALIFGLIAGAAFAAKGGNSSTRSHGGKSSGTSGTISLVLLDSTDGLAHIGQHATFDVFTTATDYPWVTVDCYQGGAVVYKQSNGMYPSSLSETFTLGPTPAWQSGAADCTAYLQDWDSYSKNRKITNLASTTFHVYP